MNLYESLQHNLRTPRNTASVDAKINKILSLCEEVYSKTGKEVTLDNTWPNHYILNIDGQQFVFDLYNSVIAALELLLLFIN